MTTATSGSNLNEERQPQPLRVRSTSQTAEFKPTEVTTSALGDSITSNMATAVEGHAKAPEDVEQNRKSLDRIETLLTMLLPRLTYLSAPTPADTHTVNTARTSPVRISRDPLTDEAVSVKTAVGGSKLTDTPLSKSTSFPNDIPKIMPTGLQPAGAMNYNHQGSLHRVSSLSLNSTNFYTTPLESPRPEHVASHGSMISTSDSAVEAPSHGKEETQGGSSPPKSRSLPERISRRNSGGKAPRNEESDGLDRPDERITGDLDELACKGGTVSPTLSRAASSIFSTSSSSAPLAVLSRVATGSNAVIQPSQTATSAAGSSGGNNSQGKRVVVKICNIPYDITKSDIAQFFTGLSIARNGIHILLDPNGRTKGDAFVEFLSLRDAREAARQSVRSRPLCGRFVTVIKSSQEELLSSLFSNETVDADGSYLTRDEIGLILQGCRKPYRKTPQRAFELIMSIVEKLPWENCSKIFRDHIFEMCKLASESLVVHCSSGLLPPTVMENFLSAIINAPFFTERQVFVIATVAAQTIDVPLQFFQPSSDSEKVNSGLRIASSSDALNDPQFLRAVELAGPAMAWKYLCPFPKMDCATQTDSIPIDHEIAPGSVDTSNASETQAFDVNVVQRLELAIEAEKAACHQKHIALTNRCALLEAKVTTLETELQALRLLVGKSDSGSTQGHLPAKVDQNKNEVVGARYDFQPQVGLLNVPRSAVGVTAQEMSRLNAPAMSSVASQHQQPSFHQPLGVIPLGASTHASLAEGQSLQSGAPPGLLRTSALPPPQTNQVHIWGNNQPTISDWRLSNTHAASYVNSAAGPGAGSRATSSVNSSVGTSTQQRFSLFSSKLGLTSWDR